MNATANHFRQRYGLILALIVLLTGSSVAAQRTEPVVVPDNGYATGASYGSGWKCNYGFTNQQGACVAVAVPVNGFLSERGDRWRCARGYRQAGNECQMIQVPANGYLTDSSQSSWKCERGYRATRDTCEAIDVPANAYLTDASFGDAWKCERGYRQTRKECIKINVPANAFLVHFNYGPGWQCERGYIPINSEICKKILVPPNAHLSRAGDEWQCNSPYAKRGDSCVIR